MAVLLGLVFKTFAAEGKMKNKPTIELETQITSDGSKIIIRPRTVLC